jgi:hypothetical protein
VRNWKHNLLASAALGIAVALFLFISNYVPTFSGEGGATSHWRNAEGGLLVGSIYFVTLLSVLTLVRLFRNLS